MSDLKHRLLSFAPSSSNRALLPAACVVLMTSPAVLQLLLPQDNPLSAPRPARRAPQWTLPEIGVPTVTAAVSGSSVFAPTRLAMKAAASTDGEEDPDAEAEAPKPKRVGQLGGAFVLGRVRIGAGQAVLVGPGDGRVIRLAPGTGYGGWRLVSIGANAAVFQRGGKRREFRYGASDMSSESEASSE